MALDGRLSSQKPEQLFRLNPRALATELSLDEGLAIDVFLAAVLEGWFDLRWEFHCSHCDAIPSFTTHLKEATTGGSCAACNMEYRNVLDQSVEITFTAAPKLAEFSPGQLDDLLLAYNMVSIGRFKSEGSAQDEPRTPQVSGLDLLHRAFFQEHFGGEILSSEESLEIRNVVFLFTDIKGSTMLYEQLGDASAYNLVRQHFKVLFQAVTDHGGVVVKTIGDAVMASFRRPDDALKAALQVHDSIDALKVPGTEDAVVVKMGLHSGPAIAVTMNDRFDYFGQTVNRAARIQGLAHDQEIYFSESVFQDTSSRRLLASRKAAVRKWRTQLKGIEGDQVVYSVK